MKEVEELVGKSLYLIGYTIDQAISSQGLLLPFEHPKDVQTYFNTVTADSIGEATLMHGVLTKARSIPAEVHEDLDIILVIPFASSDHDSYIKKFANLVDLATYIELLVSNDGVGWDAYDHTIPEEIVEELMDMDLQNIEDLYVLYGYEIELHYAYDKEEVDAELIAAAKTTFSSIESQQ